MEFIFGTRLSTYVFLICWISCMSVSRCAEETPIKKVHLIFMNHLDVGYSDGRDGDVGFISQVINRYFAEFFPRAIQLSAQLRGGNFTEEFVYTTQPWLVSLYLHCPNISFLSIPLKCPTPGEQDLFRASVKNGSIAWHAGPMNMQTDNMGQLLFNMGLQIAKSLDKEFGINRTHATYSQRDVPGLTKAVIPSLLLAGIKAISVGVNPGTAPPDVPCPFVWKTSNTAKDGIMGFWVKGGYPLNPGPDPEHPGGLARDKCITAKRLDEALCFSFRTDNSGPPMNVEEILTSYKIVKSEFPGADVFASTFDNFVQALETVKSTLPVVTAEMGDTWIQGITSDPKKTSMYRAFAREFENCYQAGQCNLTDHRIQNMSRFLVKLPEHTWGAHNFLDTTSWSNADLGTARKTKNFSLTEKTWIEQRQFVDFSLNALQDHPLKVNVTKAFQELETAKPDLTGYFPVMIGDPFKCQDGSILHFSPSGGLSRFYDPYNGVDWATADSLIGQLTYDTYVEQDFVEMGRLYNYASGVGFDKPNVDKFGKPEKKQWPMGVIAAYQKGGSSCDFYLEISLLDIQTRVKYGAPSLFYVHIVLNQNLPGFDMTVLVMNKATTRLPESLSLNFKPASMKMSNLTLEKMGQPIDPCKVVVNGSQYVHAVDTSIKFSRVKGKQSGLQITSLDLPLVFIGTNSHTPSPFPVPLKPFNCSTISSVSFNLHNNIWNTNYMYWYPYLPSDVSFKARFQLAFTKN